MYICGIVMMGSAVTNRYVKSLYTVSAALGLREVVLSQLTSVKDCIVATSNYKKYLKKFTLVSSIGHKFISQLKTDLDLSKEVYNFLMLLLKNKRLPLLVEICNDYFSFVEEVDGKKKFYVTYAKNFSKLVEKQLTNSLREVFGGVIKCITSKDPSLIHGIKIQFRSKILDYSVKSKLARLHSAIRGDSHDN